VVKVRGEGGDGEGGVKIRVWGGIDEIESRNPANSTAGKHNRGKSDSASLRDPCAERSDGQCQSEKKMCCAREPLGHRIEKNQRERNGRKLAGQPIDRARRQ